MSATGHGATTGVSGFPGYLACTDGHIYSTKLWGKSRMRRLAEGRDRDGYPTVQLQRNGKSVVVAVHRIICAAFKGPKPHDDLEVRHLDGNRKNNESSNLEWGTQKENADDRDGHGQTARGERNRGGGNKLTTEKAREIKAALANGETHVALASKYGVSIALISFIKSGRLWRHA